jgi:hypothetical protein
MLILCSLAGGLWMPEANALALLRRDIDRRPQRIKAVLRNANIRNQFFGGVPDKDVMVVKKFVAQNSESALKTKPKVSSIFHFYGDAHPVLSRTAILALRSSTDDAPGSGLRPEWISSYTDVSQETLAGREPL